MTELLDGLTQWINQHHQWLGVAIFIISFLECLALAGLVVPGTVILFAVAVALVACMICYFVIYPTVLRSGRVLPVTLFGRMSALAWLITCITALAVLWYDLVWPDEFGATNFWREHGGRIAVLAVVIGFAFVWMYLWRSEAPQKSTATQLAK